MYHFGGRDKEVGYLTMGLLIKSPGRQASWCQVAYLILNGISMVTIFLERAQ